MIKVNVQVMMLSLKVKQKRSSTVCGTTIKCIIIGTIHKCKPVGRHAHVVSEINQRYLHSCEAKEIINCLHYDVQELDRFLQQIITIINKYIIAKKKISMLMLTKDFGQNESYR